MRRPLTVLGDPDEVRIVDGQHILARHRRSYDKGTQIEDAAHIQPGAKTCSPPAFAAPTASLMRRPPADLADPRRRARQQSRIITGALLRLWIATAPPVWGME